MQATCYVDEHDRLNSNRSHTTSVSYMCDRLHSTRRQTNPSTSTTSLQVSLNKKQQMSYNFIWHLQLTVNCTSVLLSKLWQTLRHVTFTVDSG